MKYPGYTNLHSTKIKTKQEAIEGDNNAKDRTYFVRETAR